MITEFFKDLKGYFVPLKSRAYRPRLKGPVVGEHLDTILAAIDSERHAREGEERYRNNMEEIELVRLEQDRDATDKNLMAQYRLMVATLIAALIALFAAVAAIYISVHSKALTIVVRPRL